jgi:hypothetical protein
MNRIINDIVTTIIIALLTGLVIVLVTSPNTLDHHNNKLLESPIDIYFKAYTTK